MRLESSRRAAKLPFFFNFNSYYSIPSHICCGYGHPKYNFCAHLTADWYSVSLWNLQRSSSFWVCWLGWVHWASRYATVQQKVLMWNKISITYRQKYLTWGEAALFRNLAFQLWSALRNQGVSSRWMQITHVCLIMETCSEVFGEHLLGMCRGPVSVFFFSASGRYHFVL